MQLNVNDLEMWNVVVSCVTTFHYSKEDIETFFDILYLINLFTFTFYIKLDAYKRLENNANM